MTLSFYAPDLFLSNTINAKKNLAAVVFLCRSPTGNFACFCAGGLFRFDNHCQFHCCVERQFGRADRCACVLTGRAEHFMQQL